MGLKETVWDATPQWVEKTTQIASSAPIEASVKGTLRGSVDEAFWSLDWGHQDLLDPSPSVGGVLP